VIFEPFFTTKEAGWGWALLSVARSSKRMARIWATANQGPHDIQCYGFQCSLRLRAVPSPLKRLSEEAPAATMGAGSGRVHHDP